MESYKHKLEKEADLILKKAEEDELRREATEEAEATKKEVEELLNYPELLPSEKAFFENFYKEFLLTGKYADYLYIQKKKKIKYKNYQKEKPKKGTTNESDLPDFDLSKVSEDEYLLSRYRLGKIPKGPKEVLNALYIRNFEILLIKYGGWKFKYGEKEKIYPNPSKAEKDLLNLLKLENTLFDREVPFPFYPISYTTFSRKYDIPCDWKTARKIIMNSEYKKYAYILKKNPTLEIKYDIFCINDAEDIDLQTLADYIIDEFQKMNKEKSQNK